MSFDWSAHRAHRAQVVADAGQWVGLLDADGVPLHDMAPVVSMSAPETRHEPASLSMQVRLVSPSGVLHPVARELLADDLDVDDRGVFVPKVDETRFVVVERPGDGPEARRAFRVVAPETMIPGRTPTVMDIDGVDMLAASLAGILCPSDPDSWTGNFLTADRDWAGPWEKPRLIQDVKMAAVATGFTVSGPAEATIRGLIADSLEAVYRGVGVTDRPIVVDMTPTGRPSPHVVIRRSDDYIWSTVAAHAAAAGVRVSAHLWLPGDTWGPAGLTKPTIVVRVRQAHDTGDFVDIPPLVADGGSVTTPRRTANYVYGHWRVTAPSGIEQIVPDATRDHGYLYRPADAPSGRFDLGFVRQDATIDLHTIEDNGAVTAGSSDVELQLEAGQKRAEGRVLLQRDVSARGLGHVLPGVDFATGDVVPVLIATKVAKLPVTAIDWLTSPSGVVSYAVRCGGQLVSDMEQLRSLNLATTQQLDAEARRAAEEERRLAEQAATDRQQTSQIRDNQDTLSYQQRQLRTHSAQVTSWSASMTDNFDIMRGLFNELRLQKQQWDLVAALFENYHNNSGALRDWAADSRANIDNLIQQLNELSPPPQPPIVT